MLECVLAAEGHAILGVLALEVKQSQGQHLLIAADLVGTERRSLDGQMPRWVATSSPSQLQGLVTLAVAGLVGPLDQTSHG